LWELEQAEEMSAADRLERSYPGVELIFVVVAGSVRESIAEHAHLGFECRSVLLVLQLATNGLELTFREMVPHDRRRSVDQFPEAPLERLERPLTPVLLQKPHAAGGKAGFLGFGDQGLPVVLEPFRALAVLVPVFVPVQRLKRLDVRVEILYPPR
jgi:hypothetical protein